MSADTESNMVMSELPGSLTVADLIKVLQTKDQHEEVEFIVVGKHTKNIVCMQVEMVAKDIADLMGMFSRGRL